MRRPDLGRHKDIAALDAGGVQALAYFGFLIKLFKPSEANLLFDGASLVLYVIGTGIYISNIVKALRDVTADVWNTEGGGTPGGVKYDGPYTGEIVLDREDSLRVLAASHTILALVLVGVLVLQAGQWYAERREAVDEELLEKQAAAEKRNRAGSGGDKKKQ